MHCVKTASLRCVTIGYDLIMIKNGGSISSVLLEHNIRVMRSLLESSNEICQVLFMYDIWSDKRKILMENCPTKVESDLADHNQVALERCYSRGIECAILIESTRDIFCFKIFMTLEKRMANELLKRLAPPRHPCGILFRVFQGKKLCAIIIMRIIIKSLQYILPMQVSYCAMKCLRYIDTSAKSANFRSAERSLFIL